MMNIYPGQFNLLKTNFALSVAVMLCSFFVNSEAKAQRVYANQVTIGAAAGDHVDNSANAISSSETTFAQLNSYGGIAVGLGAYSGQLELKFTNTVAAGVTTYVRINADAGLLKSLLGGSLGNLLANVVGSVVLGNHYFNVQARNGATTVLSGNSSTPFTTDNLKLVQDANGYYYLALTPTLAYDRVYIQDVTNALLLGTNNNTQVYYAFYNSTASSNPCLQGFSTSFDGTGLTLDLLQLGNAGVINPQRAIDADTTNYSELGLGALAVAGSISQDIYFENLSVATDEFHVKLQSAPALLNVGLANNITITTFNGSTQVSSQVLNTLLSTDLLGFLNNGQRVTAIVRPGQPVNRVRVTFSSLLNANLTQTTRYYGAIRTAGKPTFTGTQSQDYTICTGGTVGLSATTTTGNEIRWYADSTTATILLTTTSGGIYTTPALAATTKYYVAAAKIGCADESERVPVTVTVKTIPVNPVVPPVQPICTGKTATFAVSNPEAGVTYNWYAAATGGAALGTGVSFITPALTDSTTFYVEATNGTCTNAAGRTAVLVPVSKLPATVVPTPLTREICSGSTTTFAVQNPVAGITYNWYDSSTAGNLVFTGVNFVTPQLAANTNYYVEGANATGCTSTSRTQVSVIVNPQPPTPVLVTAVATINPGGTATFAVSNPDPALTYNWYATSTGGTLIATGTTYTTPVLNNTTNYYVEAVSSKGCVSSARATATVNVQNEVVCGYATTQQTINSGGICLLCSVTDAGNSVDNDYTNYSLVTATVGIGGYGQLLKFGNTYFAGDSISLVLEIPNQTIGAQLLGGISVQTYSGNNPNGDLITLDASPVKLQLMGGGTNKFKVTIPATRSFDGVAVTLSGISALSQVRIYSVQAFVPPPLLAPAAVLVRASTQESPITSGVLCAFCSVTNPLLAVDADTTTYSTISATVGLLGGVGQLVKFPGSFNAGDSVQFDLEVPGQTLGLQLLNGIQLETYTNSTANGNSVQGSSSLAQLQLLGSGNNKFRLKFAANHSFNGVLITINGVASVLSNLRVYDAAVFYSSQNIVNICGGSSAVLTVSMPQNADIKWYTTASGGTPVFTGSSYTTPPVTVNTTYYVEAGRYGCANPNRTVVNIVPNTIPDNPTLNTNAVSICQGDSAKLWATAPAGKLFKWYTVSSGGTPIYTGDTLRTGALNATTTYYVEALNNGCVSNGRTPVVVTVNSAPADVAVTPTAATIGVGQTASFTASSSTANTTYNWYSQPTGGTAVFTGPAFTTPPLTVSTTYYLEGVGASSCKLATRLVVPVTIVTGSGTPVPCDAATAQTSAVNGLCIGCNVTAPALAVDNDATTASELHVIAGLANAYVQQTLQFPFTGDAGDTIAVHVQLPVGITDIGLLSNVQLASYNGATYNNDRAAATNNGPVALQLFSGSTDAVLKFAPAQSFDRVEVRVNSGLVTLLSALNINYAQRIKASPAVTAVSATICQGSPATLLATGTPNTTFKWYTTAAGGTPLFIGASYTTPVLNDTTVYYVESVSSTGCAAALRTPFTVNVIKAPVAPVLANNPITICSGNTAVLSVQSPQAGINYNWYAAATGGTTLFTGATYTTVALTRDTVYYVEASSNAAGCTSGTRTAATIVVNTALPVPAVISDSVVTCTNSTATLSIQNPQTGITYNWYDAATGGSQVGTGASFTTPVVNSNTVYYVEAVSGANCMSPRKAVKVTAAQPPVAPVLTVVPSGATINAGETATITATSVTPNVVFNWYLQSTGGTPVFTGASFTTPALTTTTTYYVEAALSGTGCPSTTRTAVTVVVRPGVNLTCDAATSQTNSANGICLLCDVTTPAGAVDTDTATFSTLNMRVGIAGAFIEQTLVFPSVTAAGDTVSIALEGPPSLLAADILGAIQVTSFNGATSNNDPLLLNNGAVKIQLLGTGAAGKFLARFAPGAAFDRIQVRINSGIVAALSTVNVYYATRQVAPPVITTTQPVAICSGSSATLTATASPNATIEWFTTAVSGAPTGTGTTFSTGALTATTTYYVQAKRTTTSCANPNRTQVTVIVNPTPPAPTVASNNLSICSGQTAVLQVTNPQTGITYNWYNAAGTAAGTGVSITTGVLTASTTYSVEAVNSTNCASATRTTVTVTVNATAGARGIANNSTAICAGSTILNIENPEAGVTYNWYNVSTGGSIIFSGVSFTTPVLTGNTTYYIEAVSASGCSTGTRTAATVTVNPVLPAPAVVSNNVSACSGSSVTLAVQNPQSGVIYKWYTASSGGTPVATGVTYTIASATGNATYYVEATNNTGCTSSSRTAVSVTVNTQPAVPVLASNSVALCAGSSATLAIQTPVSGVTYRWYDAAIGGNLLFTGTSYATPALSATTSYYVEGVSGTGCTSSARAVATVTVNPIPPIPVIAGGNVSVCTGTSVALNVQNPQTGITYNWYNAASGGSLVYTGASFPTPALSSTTTYYVEARSAAGCGSSVRAAVTITVNTVPAAPVITGGGAVCSITAVTLTVQNPQAGVTYNWYSAATSGTLLFTGTSITTPSLTATTTYYVEAVNGSCASASRTQVTVTVNTRPDNPVIAATGTTVCIGQTTTLSVQNPQNNFVYSWYNAGSGGTLLATGSNFTTPVLNASASYYVEVSNGTCTNTVRTRVDVTAVQPPPAPVIAAGGTTVCAGSATTLSIQSPQTGYTYNWYDAATGGNLLFSGTSYTTNVLNANTTFYVSAALNTGCSSSTRTSVTVTVNPAPAVPAVVSANVSGCTGSAVTLQVQNPASGATYSWYTVATGGTPVFTGPNYTITVAANVTYYVGTVSNTGCPSLTRASVNVTALAAPAAPAITNNTPAVCSGSMVTLTASSPASGTVFSWYATATGTTVLATGSSFTAGPITSDTTFYVSAVNTAGCGSAGRGQTTITLLKPLAAPVVTVDNTTAQSVTFKWAAVPGATGYQVTQDGGNTFVVPNGTSGLTHTISGLQPNQSVSIQVRALGAMSCQTSPLSATVTGTATNPLGNSVYVPNVFTPNSDGRNDYFTVFGNNIKDVEMWIFSQWGDMLFHTKDRIGWNGMVGNKLQPVGAYVYVLKITLQDGTVLDRKGVINLVR